MIQDVKPVNDTLNKLSKRKAAKSITTHNFSILYTNIPHEKLIQRLNSVLDFAI